MDPIKAKIYPINTIELNLINKLLQTNYTAPLLQEHYKKVKDINSLQSLKNGLLKYKEWLVVAKKQNLWTQLILEAHTQVSMAYLRKNKTYKNIGNRYYQCYGRFKYNVTTTWRRDGGSQLVNTGTVQDGSSGTM